MKKLKNEKALFKKAMQIGEALAVKSGYSAFKPTDSADEKAEAIYRMLVHLKLLTPLPEDQETGVNIRHRLAKWIAGKLPKDDPLLQ
ncbi:DUF5062 family protein [Ferrimonas marina]|uniref:DUF5062 domain-containing protein n=1 Tax=Ferrimonas marina TaxID=299255 RepID=A0A1M5X388_9GAMM|nr:DUF5062 family protein [Ferrimonas marina]SHH94297.1 protein of unknown function [Ferrimonas marina]